MEGGGLRGIYTSGVLRFFMDKGITFPYVVGVSMGACNGANYVSDQAERNRIVNTRFVNDPRYISYRRLFLKGELFGMNFIFNTIPNQLVPFDYQAFNSSPQKFIVGATDCNTGQAVYFDHKEFQDDFLLILQASCSLPFMAHVTKYKEMELMDGGISDSIPLHKSMTDGNKKHVLILTQPEGYRKKPSSWNRLVGLKYPQYPGLYQALKTRHQRYNEVSDEIDSLLESQKVFAIRPKKKLKIGRAERNKEKLMLAYDTGYYDAMDRYEDLVSYLSNDGL